MYFGRATSQPKHEKGLTREELDALPDIYGDVISRYFFGMRSVEENEIEPPGRVKLGVELRTAQIRAAKQAKRKNLS